MDKHNKTIRTRRDCWWTPVKVPYVKKTLCNKSKDKGYYDEGQQSCRQEILPIDVPNIQMVAALCDAPDTTAGFLRYIKRHPGITAHMNRLARLQTLQRTLAPHTFFDESTITTRLIRLAEFLGFFSWLHVNLDEKRTLTMIARCNRYYAQKNNGQHDLDPHDVMIPRFRFLTDDLVRPSSHILRKYNIVVSQCTAVLWSLPQNRMLHNGLKIEIIPASYLYIHFQALHNTWQSLIFKHQSHLHIGPVRWRFQHSF